MSWLGIIITFALIDNVILSRLLGICPCVGASGHMRAAMRRAAWTGALMALSALAAWTLDSLVLRPLDLGFLRTPAFVLVVAGLARLLEVVAARVPGPLAPPAGFSIHGSAANCAVLGVVLITSRGSYTPLECLVAGIAAGLGYALVIALMTAIREKLEVEQAPQWLRGLPLQLVSAGLLAYAFMAFDRAFLSRVLGG